MRRAAHPAGPIQLEPSKRSILARLRESELALDAARRDLLEAARLGHSMTAAAEWLLDNAYLIRTQIAETRRHLPRDYPKLLPGLRARHTCPDVYDLAERLVAGADHALNEANITECLRQYQTVAPLTIAELWLFPLLLRMALFEALARLASRVSRAQQLREVAYLWANRLAVSMRRGADEFEKMLARLETEPFALQPCFVTSLAERLQDEENALGPVKHWIEDRGKIPLTDLLRSEHSNEASERISTANAFGSLRASPESISQRYSRRSVWSTPNCVTIPRACMRRATSRRATNAAGWWSESLSRAESPSWM